MEIGPRFREIKTHQHGNSVLPSDGCHVFSRVINGKAFDFSRIRWADGNITIFAWKGGTTTLLHEWSN